MRDLREASRSTLLWLCEGDKCLPDFRYVGSSMTECIGAATCMYERSKASVLCSARHLGGFNARNRSKLIMQVSSKRKLEC